MSDEKQAGEYQLEYSPRVLPCEAIAKYIQTDAFQTRLKNGSIPIVCDPTFTNVEEGLLCELNRVCGVVRNVEVNTGAETLKIDYDLYGPMKEVLATVATDAEKSKAAHIRPRLHFNKGDWDPVKLIVCFDYLTNPEPYMGQ